MEEPHQELFCYREKDLNTRLFHATPSSRRKMNKIEQIHEDNSLRCKSEEGLRHVMREYFTRLFRKTGETSQYVINFVPLKVTSEDNDMLATSFCCC